MTSIADIVRILHDIDAAKGRVCGNCHYRTRRDYGGHCRLGHSPAGPDDGCDDFRGRPVDSWKAWPLPRQPAVRER